MFTFQTFNPQRAIISAPGVVELAAAHEGAVLPPGSEVGHPAAFSRVFRGVAQPPVLMAHHSANQPAVRSGTE